MWFIKSSVISVRIAGSLIVGGTSAQSAAIKMLGTGGNNQAGFFRVGASAADLKIGRMLLFDDGTQKVQISAKGKSFIASNSASFFSSEGIKSKSVCKPPVRLNNSKAAIKATTPRTGLKYNNATVTNNKAVLPGKVFTKLATSEGTEKLPTTKTTSKTKTTFSTLYQNIITHIKDYESCDKLESHTYVCNENMVKYMKTIIKKIDDLNFLN